MMQELSIIDNLPASNVELEPEKIEDVKIRGPAFRCDLYDTELVHKIAQVFIPGLATACVDNTSGDLFRTPASVAADMRKEMIEYVTQRSETFVAESVILEGGPDAQVSDHPYDIISDFIDDFASSKRNFFVRVSGWLLSEKREDNIDDFVQEMEVNGFWLIDRREAIAQNFLRNVDSRNEHHCNMKFDSPEELAEHVSICSFRSMTCNNEGCTTVFCASHMEKHDSICPFKIIPCEQNCSRTLMRREMDRHCITVCPMKLVSCPFYAVGCQSPVPHCKVDKHRSDYLHSHLLFILQSFHKGTSAEDLENRAELLEKASSSSQLAEARDVRSLTSAVKGLEEKLGPLEVSSKYSEEHAEKFGLSELSSKLPEDLEVKLDPKEESGKAPDDVEEKLGPKETGNKPIQDIEANHGPKDVGRRSFEGLGEKLVPKQGNSKRSGDLEEKPTPKEVNKKTPEDVESRLELKEMSSKPLEDLEVKFGPKEMTSKPQEDPETKEGTKETNSNRQVDLETKQGSKEMSSKPSEDLEEKLGPKEMGSKPSDDVETKLGPKEISSKPFDDVET